MTQIDSCTASDYFSLGRQIADVLEVRIEHLLDLWEALGDDGPTCGSMASGPPEMRRARFLLPLGRLLVGGLRGSDSHAAVYYDERHRYLDSTLSEHEQAEFIEERMDRELEAIAGLAADLLDAADVQRTLRAFHAPLITPPAESSRVLFIGDCLFVETRAFLGQLGVQDGSPVHIRQVFFSARQPADSVNTAIVRAIHRESPDLIGLSLFTFDGLPPYGHAWRQAGVPVFGRSSLRMVQGLVDVVRETIADIRTVTDSTIAVHIPGGVPLTRFRRRLSLLPAHSHAQRRFLSDLSRGLYELIGATENTIALDERSIIKQLGGARRASAPLFDDRDVPSGYAHTSAFGPGVAREYHLLLREHNLLSRAKALLVDFDNTLWSGVMADGEVVQNTEGQRLLKELKNAGVLLVALSKNDASSIRWTEMELDEDDFALQKINWVPKPDNVSAAIQELDLAPSAFVLLDDNPAERALVTEQVPGVRALDPGAPDTWRALRRWLDFPSTRQTAEARGRTRMYREAAERRIAIAGTHDYAAMMQTLDLRYSTWRARQSDLPRVLELIQRTSQFNTTTRRRTTSEVQALLNSDQHPIYVASLKDRFGDLGVVALTIFERVSRTFDSVIMSCRAMGFGLELALLRDVMDAEGPGLVTGLFVPTQRNSPAADLFARAGFVEQDGTWVLNMTTDQPPIPPWLARE